MKWKEKLEAMRDEIRAERAREAEKADRSLLCYDCLRPEEALTRARSTLRTLAQTSGPVGLTGPRECPKCGKPRTLLPDEAHEAP
jgi:hypothetical protein